MKLLEAAYILAGYLLSYHIFMDLDSFMYEYCLDLNGFSHQIYYDQKVISAIVMGDELSIILVAIFVLS